MFVWIIIKNLFIFNFTFWIYTPCYLFHITHSMILYLFTFELLKFVLFFTKGRYTNWKFYHLFYNIINTAFFVLIISSDIFAFLTKLSIINFYHFSFNFMFSLIHITSRNSTGILINCGLPSWYTIFFWIVSSIKWETFRSLIFWLMRKFLNTGLFFLIRFTIYYLTISNRKLFLIAFFYSYHWYLEKLALAIGDKNFSFFDWILF